MYPPVQTKKDFTRRYRLGEFGNHSPTWETLKEFLDDYRCVLLSCQLNGLVHLRNRVAGGDTYYNLRPSNAISIWRSVDRPQDWYLSEMAPTDQTLFQGEVMRGIWGLELTYTTVAKPMREALQEKTNCVRGIIASSFLRYYLDDNSYDWLEVLLDRYPDHVIEFSTYSICWGTLPHYNTVFWEVRKY